MIVRRLAEDPPRLRYCTSETQRDGREANIRNTFDVADTNRSRRRCLARTPSAERGSRAWG
jgi:hypothetical protein